MTTRWPVTNADQVRDYVAATGVACPRCRYPLKGVRDPVCPECGAQLSVRLLSRPRGLVALRGLIFGAPEGGPRPLRTLAALNVVLAAAIMASSVMHSGELPLLSWLAPGVLGACMFSLQYVSVFAKYCPARHDPVEGWGEGIAALVLLTQIGGLVMMWV
jgi:hypothetical protein